MDVMQYKFCQEESHNPKRLRKAFIKQIRNKKIKRNLEEKERH